jgi:hypothetical protein
MSQSRLTLTVSLHYEGTKHGEKPPETALYAFDSTGQFLAQAAVEEGRGTLTLPAALANQTVRVFAGPPPRGKATPSIATLQRQDAYEVRQRLGTDSQALPITVYSPVWRNWLLCPCVVTGQLVTTITLPSGGTQTLPLCNSQVTICEVRPWFWILQTLPDSILFRLRDEVIGLATNPPVPQPAPVETSAAARFALSTAPARAAAPPMLRPVGSTLNTLASATPAATRALPLFDDAARVQIASLQSALTAEDLRARLLPLQAYLIDWFCWWDWLEPFWRLAVDCIETVGTDSNGNFFAVIWYPCDGPTPNLYFSAEQLQGSSWVPIYQPFVRCGTYWNYSCGTSIVLNVTDPAAIPCAPPQSVNPPGDVDNWVMVTAVGNTFVWGTYPPPPAPAGWVQPDGLTNYGAIVNAPFGGYLGLRSGPSLGIPGAAGITYYRWSYRALGASGWTPMTDNVVQHYAKQVPGGVPSFPVESMGPFTIGGAPALFTFKPVSPPPAAASDPPGTFTYWPTDDLFADIYSGYFNTASLPNGVAAAAGVYQIKLEVFDSAGTLIDPSASTFTFIVPQSVAPDGTVTTRAADASEIEAGGFVFNLHIDNNICGATIDPPAISGVGAADGCGFLEYGSNASPVAIDFAATHPNGFAVFDFTVTRGATDLGTPDVPAWSEVWASAAGPYSGDGSGDFTGSFTVGALLGPTCVNAAFAEVLYVAAKATTGWGDRISQYDAQFVRAFALAANS